MRKMYAIQRKQQVNEIADDSVTDRQWAVGQTFIAIRLSVSEVSEKKIN